MTLTVKTISFLQQTLMLPTEGRCFQIGLRHRKGYSTVDPMEIVLEEGGPFHTRGHLPEYITDFEKRSHWADVLKADTRQNFRFR